MKFNSAVSAALISGLASAHVKPIPLETERILTPNSYTPEKGCKYLPADKGWPAPEQWTKAMPKVIAKRPGTRQPDYALIARNVEDVQAAVNFARDNNVRLSIITTGHDFHGRETARSGLSIDMSHFTDVTLAPSWKCGDVLAPPKKCEEEPEPMKMPGGRLFRRTTGHGPECKGYNVISPIEGQQAVARVGAGVFNQYLTNAAHESGLYPIGAQHGSVSLIGGWGQTAGHSPFANRHGLGADQIVELEVVTADGRFVKASACQNPDLYWALRGGGGSTFGVVTAGTVKVYKTPKILVSRFFVNGTTVESTALAIAHFLKEQEGLLKNYGIQGYYYAYPKAFQGVLFQDNEYATKEVADKGYLPLIKEMNRLAGGTPSAPAYDFYDNYKTFYDAEMGPMETEDDDDMSQTEQAQKQMTSDAKYKSWYDGSDGSGPSADDVEHDPIIVVPYIAESPNPQKRRARRSLTPERIVRPQSALAKRWASIKKRLIIPKPAVIPDFAMPPMDLVLPTRRTYLDSRLLPTKDLQTIPLATLGKAIADLWPLNFTPKVYGPVIRGFAVGGGKVASPDTEPNSVNPAWRTAQTHFILNAVVGDARNDFNISSIANVFKTAGAYSNEASPHATEWKDLYWGSNYNRLFEIKRKWDPKDVFWCSPCIAADRWTYDDERLCLNDKFEAAAGTRAKPQKSPETLINLDSDSKVGLLGLPGKDGIEDPLVTWVESSGMKFGELVKAKSDYDPTKDPTNAAYVKPAGAA